MAPERNSSSRNCTLWNPLAGASRSRKTRKSCGVIVSSTATCRISTSSIATHPGEQVPGPPEVAGEHLLAGRRQLVQQLLEPQLVDLVDGDEQQLVVGRRVGLQVLLVEQLGDPQVGAVGQPGPLLTEVPVRLDVALVLGLCRSRSAG